LPPIAPGMEAIPCYPHRQSTLREAAFGEQPASGALKKSKKSPT